MCVPEIYDRRNKTFFMVNHEEWYLLRACRLPGEAPGLFEGDGKCR